MRKKRGKKKMAPTSVISLSERRKKQQESKFTKVKPIKELTPKQMKSTVEVLNNFDERD